MKLKSKFAIFCFLVTFCSLSAAEILYVEKGLTETNFLEAPQALAQNESGDLVFVAANADCKISMFSYSELEGLTLAESIPSYPDQFPECHPSLHINNLIFVPTTNLLLGVHGKRVNSYRIDDAGGSISLVNSEDFSSYGGFSGSRPEMEVTPDGMRLYISSSTRLDIFNIDPDTGTLTPTVPRADPDYGIPTAADGGDLAFSPSGEVLYLAGEGQLAVYSVDSASGALSILQLTRASDLVDELLSTVPGLDGVSSILLSPNGDYLFSGSQQPNTLGLWSVSEADGTLIYLEGYVPDDVDGQAGDHPALAGADSLSLSSDGSILLTHNTQTEFNFSPEPESGEYDGLSAFSIDSITGELSYRSSYRPKTGSIYSLEGISSTMVSNLSGNVLTIQSPREEVGDLVVTQLSMDGMTFSHIDRVSDRKIGIHGLDGEKALAASIDGRFVYLAGSDGFVSTYSVTDTAENPELIQSLALGIDTPLPTFFQPIEYSIVRDMQIDPSGERLIVDIEFYPEYGDGIGKRLFLFGVDRTSGQLEFEFMEDIHADKYRFSHDGASLFAIDYRDFNDSKLRRFLSTTGGLEPVGEFDLNDINTTSIYFTDIAVDPAGSYLAICGPPSGSSTGPRGRIALFTMADTQSGVELKDEIRGEYCGGADSIEFSQSGNYLYVVNAGDVPGLFDLFEVNRDSGEPQLQYFDHFPKNESYRPSEKSPSINISPDGKHLLLTILQGYSFRPGSSALRLFDLSKSERRPRLSELGQDIFFWEKERFLKFVSEAVFVNSENLRFFVAGGAEETLQGFRVASGVNFSESSIRPKELNTAYVDIPIEVTRHPAFGTTEVDFRNIKIFSTADHGEDYQILEASSESRWEVTKRLEFSNGESSKQVTVRVFGDEAQEPDESVDLGYLFVSGNVGYGNVTEVDFLIVNDDGLPSISAVSSVNFVEDGTSGVQTLSVSDDTVSGADLVLSARSSHEELIPTSGINLGGVAGNRTMTITPAANRSGSAVVTLQLSDGNSTVEHPINVTVNPVNDAPAATLALTSVTAKPGENVTLDQLVTDFQPNAQSAEDADEADQEIQSIRVDTDRPELFTQQPSINSDGNLQFVLKQNVEEGAVATLNLQVQDSGGTANGGVDMSEPVAIEITAAPTPNAPIPGAQGSTSQVHAIPATRWYGLMLLMLLLAGSAGYWSRRRGFS